VIGKSLLPARRGAARLAAAPMLALAALLAAGGVNPLLPAQAEARTVRGAQQIGGTWDAVWRNRRGEVRRGLIVIDQRGSQLSARIESHGNVTATGSIAGSTFTLMGTRSGVPFTVTGTVRGNRMAGTLSAILTERRFTAVRRKKG
jgi:hypothetical protein